MTLSVTKRPLKNGPSLIIGSGIVNAVFYLFGAAGEIWTLNVATGETKLAARYDSSLDDGPPLTGVFGVISAVEPNAAPAAKDSKVVSPASARSSWPKGWEAASKH